MAEISQKEERIILHFPADTPVPMPGGHWERQGEELIAAFTPEEAVFALAWADFTTGQRAVEKPGEEQEQSPPSAPFEEEKGDTCPVS